MTPTRRSTLTMGLAGSLAAALAAKVARAAGSDAASVEAAVDALTRAMLAGDGPALEALTMESLSYGHSSGAVQDRAAFVDSLASRKSSFPRIVLSDRTAAIVGEDAIVRHVFTGESTADGKTVPVHIGVLQVWHRDDGRWRLLARQAFKL